MIMIRMMIVLFGSTFSLKHKSYRVGDACVLYIRRYFFPFLHLSLTFFPRCRMRKVYIFDKHITMHCTENKEKTIRFNRKK